jgi:hypothetical protein
MSKQSLASQRLKKFIEPAFKSLRSPITPEQIDSMVSLVTSSMLGAGRFFHTPDHVVHVGEGGDALSAIAALFHDLVYFQVDQGVNLTVAGHLASFVQERDGDLYLRDEGFEHSPFVVGTLGIFDFQPGDLLPLGAGRNEFLSALTAASLLEGSLTIGQYLQVAACIEATIPFRSPNQSGETRAEVLFGRLKGCNAELKAGLSPEETEAAIARAVRMANQDLSDFGGDDSRAFLKNTWDLVPEMNPLLRNPESSTLTSYRQALEQMERFFTDLDPRDVFQRFGAEPSPSAWAKLVRNAHGRVKEASLYFRLKLTSLAVLEAIAGTLGKNLGLGVLMGELSHFGSPEERIHKCLPPVQARGNPKDAMEVALLGLLDGVDQDSSRGAAAGLNQSPLTAYMVRSVGLKFLLLQWEKTPAYFNGAIDTGEFLSVFPLEFVGNVSDAFSAFLKRRAQHIRTFVGDSEG